MEPELLELLTDTCTVHPFSGNSAMPGGESYGTPASHDCMNEPVSRRLSNRDGDDVWSTGSLWLNGTPGITARDKVVFGGVELKVITVEHRDDEVGSPYYTRINYG